VTGGCSLAAPVLGVAAADAPRAKEAIDAHTHFYRTPWPDTMPAKQREAAFARPCLPDDLITVARAAGITGTVVVESSPDLDDNQWLLDLAARDPFIRGVVGRIDPAAADCRVLTAGARRAAGIVRGGPAAVRQQLADLDAVELVGRRHRRGG